MDSALESWNPWWADRGVPRELQGHPRQATARLVKELNLPEVLALTGIRRSGKSTIMYQLVNSLLDEGVDPRDILFANLEDPGLDDLDLEALRGSVPGGGGPKRYLFLDEVQGRPGWERQVRVWVDQKLPVKVVVSGSSSDLTRGEFARLLTGRNLTHTIRPLDFAETMKFREGDETPLRSLREQYMPYGGFPEPILRDPGAARALLEQYFHDILGRDLVARRRLDPERVERLALYLAEAFGGPHTKRRLANATNIAPETLRTYLEAMQEAYLIHLIPRFTDSPKPARETEAPFKVYWADTGLRNAVVREPGRNLGTQAENLVALALTRTRRPYYWTDGTGRNELDFLWPQPQGRLDAFQVWYQPGTKSWDEVPQRELAAFEALRRTLPKKRHGRSTMITAELTGQRDGVEAIPLHAWLLDQTPTGPT